MINIYISAPPNSYYYKNQISLWYIYNISITMHKGKDILNDN